MPEHLTMKMFSVAVSSNRTDFVVTNDNLQHCTDDTKKICAIRWFVEQFHREIKQLTGVDNVSVGNIEFSETTSLVQYKFG
jgi:hypothetical protein